MAGMSHNNSKAKVGTYIIKMPKNVNEGLYDGF